MVPFNTSTLSDGQNYPSKHDSKSFLFQNEKSDFHTNIENRMKSFENGRTSGYFEFRAARWNKSNSDVTNREKIALKQSKSYEKIFREKQI